MENMQPNMPPPAAPVPVEHKKNTWLWVVVIIILLAIGGYLGWSYFQTNNSTSTVTSTPTSSPTSSLQGASDDLTATDKELTTLDDNFNQLDKIDSTEDNNISL